MAINAARAANRIHSLTPVIGHLSINFKRLLYKSYVDCYVAFCAQITFDAPLAHSKCLISMQTKFCKRALGLSKGAPSAIGTVDLTLLPVAARMREIAVKYIRYLEGIADERIVGLALRQAKTNAEKFPRKKTWYAQVKALTDQAGLSQDQEDCPVKFSDWL
ncbi:hypothetical protein BCR37DRAFT_115375 [Protomyces lactucae-debilis]|uniref:Uncharacterized protein n=1 Tax=Protomyces lactucae-debilis TaxID=2754530 RepID=A0A1Y2F3B7_PROLT|nr:uncharacterized protein BCR37DRAFT_115375 [Protomyces lactucae-debilis]ORY78177.1 hypothetical protein BCR37DRAFT_115375 [Protomyces lactucae-debilis]